MAKTIAKNTATNIAVKPSDYVLIGNGRASYPNTWFLGYVIWTDGVDILVNRATTSGDEFREVIHFTAVRAIGDMSVLNDIKRRTSESVRELYGKIRDAETVLGEARDALWKKIDGMAELTTEIIPPDFAEVESERERKNDILDNLHAENAKQSDFEFDFQDHA